MEQQTLWLSIVGAYEQSQIMLKQYFLRLNEYFGLFSSTPVLSRIDVEGIASKATCDTEVVSAFNEMVANSDLQVHDHVVKDVLQNIVNV